MHGSQHKPGAVAPGPPGASTSTVRDSYHRSEGAGVGFGLSTYAKLDSESQGMSIDESVNSFTGNSKMSVAGNPLKQSVSSKGHSFEIC